MKIGDRRNHVPVTDMVTIIRYGHTVRHILSICELFILYFKYSIFRGMVAVSKSVIAAINNLVALQNLKEKETV